MGEKGAKHTHNAADAAEQYLDLLADAGEVTGKKMFGGYGLFEQGVMFGMVTSAGELCFRVDDTTQARYEAAGSAKHGKMPYFKVPDDVVSDPATVVAWAREAITAANKAKK